MLPGAAQDPLHPVSAINTPISLLVDSIWEMPESIRPGLTTAQNYARRFYKTTGKLQWSLVTVYNTLDPLVPFELRHAVKP